MPAPRRCDAVECATAQPTIRIGRTLIDQPLRRWQAQRIADRWNHDVRTPPGFG